MGSLVFALCPQEALSNAECRLQVHLDNIKRQYAESEYEHVLEEIAEARRCERSVDDEVLLSLYEGIVSVELSKPGKAEAAFRAALLARPGVRLPEMVSPKIEALFEELRKKSPQQDGSRLSIQNPPQPPRAQEPQALDLPRGAPSSGPDLVTRQRPGKGPALSNLALFSGVTLLALGSASWGLAKNEQRRIRRGDWESPTLAEVRRSASRGKVYQTLGFSLMGAGVAGVGVATSMYIVGEDDASPSLGVGVNGESAFIFGRWL